MVGHIHSNLDDFGCFSCNAYRNMSTEKLAFSAEVWREHERELKFVKGAKAELVKLKHS